MSRDINIWLATNWHSNHCHSNSSYTLKIKKDHKPKTG